ncbi:EpsG family protein [Agrilactobacillus fermenti]|uniref:EpsG family protein n=1 Tax=Agrilactobacillus fermenti TaxID=2586909 RepID=UPI001E452D7B|nr:EpsG family protein [Agrilactobacillus fermenti]MCD2255878.1 EpsG family protein [Agrilactobacillus fermenti]
MIYIIMLISATFLGMIIDSQRKETMNINDGSIIQTTDTSRKAGQLLLLLIIFLILLIPAAIRFNVGTDYQSYINDQIPRMLSGDNTGFEPLYRVIAYFSVVILHNYQWLYVFTHLILLVFILKFVDDNSTSIAWGVFIFITITFYNTSLNMMRQSIAICVFLYAIKYIVQRRLFIYLFWVIVACGFHKSAVIFVPIYLITYLKFKPKLTSLLLVSALPLAYVIRKLTFYTLSALNLYVGYFNSGFDTGKLTTVFLICNAIVYIFSVIVLSRQSKLRALSRLDIVSFYLEALALLVCITSAQIPLSARIIWMFMPIQMVLIPNLLRKVDSKSNYISMSFLFIIMYIAIFIQQIYINNYGATLPYHTIFNELVEIKMKF